MDKGLFNRLGPHHPSSLFLSAGAPQGCVVGLFLDTHDYMPSHTTDVITIFADDRTVVGLISRGDKTAYRWEIQRLTDWCAVNNLVLDTKKTS